LNIARVLVAALVLLTLQGEPADCQARWPRIQAVRQDVTYAADRAGDTPFLVVVRDVDDVPRYRFECHNGDYDAVIGFTYSGDFHCALFAIHGATDVSGNLLSDDSSYETSTDWANRGRVLARQLREPCVSLAEYGAIRHFRLRGMTMTMRFVDIESRRIPGRIDPALGRFTFIVSVEPDARATTAQAERVQVPRPPRECGF
jgi:hypothetical protein